MGTAADVLAHKGTKIYSISKTASARDAAVRMNEDKVGALLVLEENRIIGIITERDLLRRVLAVKKDPEMTTVEQVMSSNVICGLQDADLDEIRQTMMQRRIRHLPIVSPQDEPMGLISIGDLNAWKLDGHEKTIYYLREYIQGSVVV